MSTQTPGVTTDETGIMQSSCCHGSIVMGDNLRAECDECGQAVAQGIGELSALLGTKPE